MKKIFGILAVLTVLGLTSCGASWERQVKSIKSNYTGGLKRVAVLYSYDGKELGRWEGKFDIESASSNGAIYFDLDGKRIWIKDGILVIEEQ